MALSQKRNSNSFESGKLLQSEQFSLVLNDLIRKSERIDVAVMFVRYSGLWLIRDSLIKALEKRSIIHILLGLDFFLTDIKVLKYLHKLMCKYYNLKVRVYQSPHNVTFHPKFYLFSTKKIATVVLGSSNLSQGGILDNIEANIISTDPLLAVELSKYFNRLFKSTEEGGNSIELCSDIIKKYHKESEKVRNVPQKIKNSNKRLLTLIRRPVEIKLHRLKELLKDASSFAMTEEFIEERKNRSRKIETWYHTLDIPKFKNISREGWNSLYKEGSIGGLNPIWRDRLWRNKPKLVRNLTFICNEQFPIEVRVENILRHDLYLKGFNIGTITKILTIFDPDKYGVWNNRATEFLKRYSAEITTGVTVGRKYKTWLSLLQKIRKCGYRNLAEVDYFVWRYSYDREKRK